VFLFVTYHFYVQCPLVEMTHQCPSVSCRRDATYVLRGAKRSPINNPATAPDIRAEVSAQTRVVCVPDRPRTNLESRHLPAMVVAHARFHGGESYRQHCAGFLALSTSKVTWVQLGTRQTRHCPEKW